MWLTPPPVAATVKVNAALLAVFATAMVSVAVPEPVIAPLELTVTPAGIPVALTATGDAKPGVPATVTVALPVAPGSTVSDAGLTVIENVGVTVRARVAVFVTPPPVAVIVREWAPAAAVLPTTNVTVALPEPVMDPVVVAVTPVGNPAALTATEDTKPGVPATLTVALPDAPATTVSEAGLTVIEKVGVTVRARVAVFVTPPPVAVIVREWAPAAAVLPTTNVTVALPEPVMDPVVVAVTPVGNPAALTATEDTKPGLPATLTVALPDAPATTVTEAALTVIENVGVTVRVRAAVFVTPPPVAVIVREWVPAAALAEAATVNATLVAVGAPAVSATPAGTPATLSVTGEVKLLLGAMLRENPALAPATTLRVLGLSVSANVGAGATVMVTVAVLVSPPPAAVTVAVYVPPAAAALAVTESVLDPAPGNASVAGANVAVTPVGNELRVSVTDALKPATVIVVVPGLPPAVTAILALETASDGGTPRPWRHRQ